MSPNVLKELFLEELADIHDGERWKARTLPKPAKSATHADLHDSIAGKATQYGMASYDGLSEWVGLIVSGHPKGTT